MDDAEEDEFHTCPIQFIPPNVFGWYREYGYYKEFPGSAPPYHDRDARWLEAMSVYTQAYARFLREQHELRRNKGGMSSQDVGQLKRMFRERHGTDD